MSEKMCIRDSCRAEAELELAVSLGLIGQAGFDALEQRRLQKNEENRDVYKRQF